MSASWYSQLACSSTVLLCSASLLPWHLCFQLGTPPTSPVPLCLNPCIQKKEKKNALSRTPPGTFSKKTEKQPGDAGSWYCAFKAAWISPAETHFKWHIFCKMTLTFAPIGVNAVHELPVDFPFGRKLFSFFPSFFFLLIAFRLHVLCASISLYKTMYCRGSVNVCFGAWKWSILFHCQFEG